MRATLYVWALVCASLFGCVESEAPIVQAPAQVGGENVNAAQPTPSPPAGTPEGVSATPAPNGSSSPTDPMQDAMRPPAWNEVTHGNDAPANYDVVFAANRVQRLDITIAPETHQQMMDDLMMLLGPPGTGGFGPGGGGGPPGGSMFAEMVMRDIAACQGKNTGDSCMSAQVGVCMEVFGSLACLPEGFMPPGPGGAPGGGGDLVAGDPAYVPVTVRHGDGTWTDVAMRFKGNSSLVAAWGQGVRKIGFRLHFDRFEDDNPQIADQRFHGFRELTFSSGWNDPSLIRDALAAEVFSSLELPAARTAFYQIYVDVGQGPQYWGLYTMIEDPSDALLDAQFGDDSGNLYKPEGGAATFSHFDATSFEKKSNEAAADYSDVVAAIEALHSPRADAGAWRQRLEAVFDVPSFLEVLAVSRAIGHWDGYGVMPHNYYLYGDPGKNGALVWISWDHNLTWQGESGFGPFAGLSMMMDEVGTSWPLIRFLLDDPVYRAMYTEALQRTVREGLYRNAEFQARALQLHALVAPYVLGEGGHQAEAAPYTFVDSPDAFRTALTDPTQGILVSADRLRAAIAETNSTGATQPPQP